MFDRLLSIGSHSLDSAFLRVARTVKSTLCRIR